MSLYAIPMVFFFPGPVSHAKPRSERGHRYLLDRCTVPGCPLATSLSNLNKPTEITSSNLKWVCLKMEVCQGGPQIIQEVDFFFEKESKPQMKKSLHVAKHQNPLVKNNSLAINYGS